MKPYLTASLRASPAEDLLAKPSFWPIAVRLWVQHAQPSAQNVALKDGKQEGGTLNLAGRANARCRICARPEQMLQAPKEPTREGAAHPCALREARFPRPQRSAQ